MTIPGDPGTEKRNFVIAYDEDGRLYTYKMTINKMQEMLTDRNTIRGLPWRVWMLFDGEMRKLDMNPGDNQG